MPVRFLGEQHVRENCRRIPTLPDWLRHLPIEPRMVNGVILPAREVPLAEAAISRWRSAVAAGQTILGYGEWRADAALRDPGAAQMYQITERKSSIP